MQMNDSLEGSGISRFRVPNQMAQQVLFGHETDKRNRHFHAPFSTPHQIYVPSRETVELLISPDAAHAIGIEYRFITHDWNILRLSLGYKHAIKRIFVRARQ